MPDPGFMMFSRPKSCQYCGNGYYAIQHALEYAAAKGTWTCIDMAESHATKEYIFPAIEQYDPMYFYGFGHGSPTIFTGDTTQEIFSVENCGNLAGRYIYLLSCLTANALGPAIIQNGALSYAGYNISWTWMNETDPSGDPYTDKYARGFWESANELWNSFCDGNSFVVAQRDCIDKYNEWIDYWTNTAPEDPESENCIMWLLWDRNGLVVVGEGGEFPPARAGISSIVVYGTILLALAGAAWLFFAKPFRKRA